VALAGPEPAPLSVPAEKAAGPANLPDAGVEDAGTPDAGSADGGATRADLVSPITAAGSETPVGLEWGEKGDEPAAKIFKNVKVLGELKGNRFMAGMQSMRANLGEKCRMCHLVKQKDFANDTKKGQTNGEELDTFGAEWYALSPAGARIAKAATSSSGAPSPAGGYGNGGYGY